MVGGEAGETGNVMDFKPCLWGEIDRNAMTHMQKSLPLLSTFPTDDSRWVLPCDGGHAPACQDDPGLHLLSRSPVHFNFVPNKMPQLCYPIVRAIQIKFSGCF